MDRESLLKKLGELEVLKAKLLTKLAQKAPGVAATNLTLEAIKPKVIEKLAQAFKVPTTHPLFSRWLNGLTFSANTLFGNIPVAQKQYANLHKKITQIVESACKELGCSSNVVVVETDDLK
jgi:hypothetical protein